MKRFLFLSLMLLACHAVAQTRSSGRYSISADSVDAAGAPATSEHYNSASSAGTVAAVSTSGGDVSKSGYLGQLYDVTGLTLTAAANTVNESGTRQLAPLLTLDDATLLAVPPNLVAWSVDSGPVSISSLGLASGQTIFADAPAEVRATYFGYMADLDLMVLNVNVDDLGTYAADGLDDAWQVSFFGEENPSAAPTIDADGDGQTNLFEFTAGLVPTDPASRFSLRIEAVPGQPAQRALVILPRLAGRTYAIEVRDALTGGDWAPLTAFSTLDNGSERRVTDFGATGPARFYRVQIVLP